MANAQRKPTIMPDPEVDYDPNAEEPIPATVYVSERAEPTDRSTGFIIAALAVVLGLLFLLSLDWSGSSTAPVVTQDNAAPATPAPESPPVTAPAPVTTQ